MIKNTKKQYIFSSSRLEIYDMSCLIIHGHYLYYDAELSIQQGTDVNGRCYFLIGNAYCTDMFPKQAIDDIINFSGNNLTALTNHWTGRWVLICENELITDAAGLMSAFYWYEGEKWIISSSLAVISSVLSESIYDSVPTIGLDWHLLPGTIMPNVNLLFCTQSINFSNGLKISFIERFTDKRHLSMVEKVNQVVCMLKTALRNIKQYSGKEIYIALTAGKDSRLTLAAALSAQVDFFTFTMEHQNMLSADKTLPREIADNFGFSWRLIKMQKKSNNLYDEYIKFNGGNSKGADIVFYAMHQHQQIPHNAIVIRSGIFEAGQSYGRRLGSTRETFQKSFIDYYYSSLESESQRTSFEKWLKYEKQHQITFVDIRDRFYIEQRVNGWLSAIEQALTINDFDSVQIANCQEIISVLLSASDSERLNNHLAYKMIESLEPSLLEYPVNKLTVKDKFNIYQRAIIKRMFK